MLILSCGVSFTTSQGPKKILSPKEIKALNTISAIGFVNMRVKVADFLISKNKLLEVFTTSRLKP